MNLKQLTLCITAVTAGYALNMPAAIAYDDNYWNWDSSINEDVSRNVNSSLDALPNGHAGVDSIQLMVGDSNADATVNTQVNPVTTAIPYDAATELGQVNAAAGAYGNVQTIDSEVALSTRLGQFHAGGFDPAVAATSTVDTSLDPAVTTTATEGNAHHLLLDELRGQAETGLLLPHQTTATATATVKDVMADVEASAISNTASINLQAEPAAPLVADQGLVTDAVTGETSYPVLTDAMLASDVTQFSYGTVNALGQSTQTLDGFTSLGAVDGQINQVTSSAIGNMGSVNVGFSDSSAP